MAYGTWPGRVRYSPQKVTGEERFNCLQVLRRQLSSFPSTSRERGGNWSGSTGTNLGKCIIAMPPSVPDGPDYRPSWEDAERLLRPMGVTVPQYGDSGSLLLIDDKSRTARSYSSYVSTVIVGTRLLYVQCWRLRRRILRSKQRAVGA